MTWGGGKNYLGVASGIASSVKKKSSKSKHVEPLSVATCLWMFLHPVVPFHSQKACSVGLRSVD